MRLLLDTHAFLWFIFADPRLTAPAAAAIGDPGNDRLLSIASIWEIAIKTQLGKLALPTPLDQFLKQQLALNQVDLLAIGFEHAVSVATLQTVVQPNGNEHRDPFDRLMVSQSLLDRLTIVSADAVFDQYGLSRIR